MRLLALDTSTTRGSCALWRDGHCIEHVCPSAQSHSETLLPLVAKLLAENGTMLPQLDAIAFASGPGAFTGLRVACAVAQGLAVGADLPVIPVGTLEAMAHASSAPLCLALLDARMGEIYSGLYAQTANGLHMLGDLRLSDPAGIEWPEAEHCLVAGNALQAYPEVMQEARDRYFSMLPDLMPGAASVAALAALKLAAGETCDPALAIPLYVRDKVARTIAERLSEGGKA